MTRCVERVDSGATRRRSRSPSLIPVSLAKTRLRRQIARQDRRLRRCLGPHRRRRSRRWRINFHANARAASSDGVDGGGGLGRSGEKNWSKKKRGAQRLVTGSDMICSSGSGETAICPTNGRSCAAISNTEADMPVANSPIATNDESLLITVHQRDRQQGAYRLQIEAGPFHGVDFPPGSR